jgi:hypothetical protein
LSTPYTKFRNHVTEQPLHVTLKQYRIVAIVGMGFIGYMMLKVWGFFEVSHSTLNSSGAAGIFTFIAALLGAFIKCFNNIQGKQEE